MEQTKRALPEAQDYYISFFIFYIISHYYIKRGMMDNLALAKLAVHVVASLGVTKVVNDIVRNNTTIVTNLDAVKVWTGALVLGSLVGEHASNHVTNRIDTVIAWNEERKATE